MNKNTIAVIGAGISGLVLTLALLRAGRSLRVYEQAPELGDVGAGLSISPNAALGLDYVGMTAFMDAHANIPWDQFTHHGETDEVLVSFDRRATRDQYGAEYYQIHRADFHAELVRRIRELDADCIHLNQKLADVEKTSDGFVLRFESGVSENVDAIVGADGLRSIVRDRLFEADDPEFTGHMAWRALISADQLPDWFSAPASHVWVGPGRSCVSYPVRGDKIVNFVGFGRAHEWVEEGWSVKAEPGEIVSAFAGWHAHPSDLVAAVPEATAYRWGLFARKPLDRLSEGRAALIGDAAHPMLPWFGQGASSSIEDAIVMARCFKAEADPAAAFARYDKARLERVTTLQRESNLGGERLQSMDPYSLKNQPVKNEDALGIFNYDPVEAPI